MASPTQLRMPAGVDLDELALGGELEHVGAMELLGMGVGVVDVGVRADRGEELRAVLREDQVAGPVAAAAQAAAAGQIGQMSPRGRGP